MESHFIPQRGKKDWEVPIYFSHLLSLLSFHFPCGWGHTRWRRWEVVMSGNWVRQTAVPLSLQKAPGGRRVPDGFSFCCTADMSCTLSGLVEHLHPLNSKKQKRGLPPAGTVWPILQTQHAMVYGAFIPRLPLASVWRVHGALSPLLFLLLLH